MMLRKRAADIARRSISTAEAEENELSEDSLLLYDEDRPRLSKRMRSESSSLSGTLESSSSSSSLSLALYGQQEEEGRCSQLLLSPDFCPAKIEDMMQSERRIEDMLYADDFVEMFRSHEQRRVQKASSNMKEDKQRETLLASDKSMSRSIRQDDMATHQEVQLRPSQEQREELHRGPGQRARAAAAAAAAPDALSLRVKSSAFVPVLLSRSVNSCDVMNAHRRFRPGSSRNSSATAMAAIICDMASSRQQQKQQQHQGTTTTTTTATKAVELLETTTEAAPEVTVSKPRST